MNFLLAIHPYKDRGVWMFDDRPKGLEREPFVAGADVIIERMVADLPGAERGFTLVFATGPFPGHQLELEWRREDMDGNWYYSPALDMEGWLCPALFRYFDAAPRKIYAQFRAKDAAPAPSRAPSGERSR